MRSTRDAIIIALDTGMRLGEIFRIVPIDVHEKSMLLHVADTKSLKPRDIPLTVRALAILQRRPKETGRMFEDQSEQQLSFRFRLERNKMLEPIDPRRFHDLRHAFASRLVNAGADPYTVMEILGHSKLEMVTRYLHTSLERKRAAIDSLGGNLFEMTKKKSSRCRDRT